jgi:hypothetical protein
MVDTTAPAASAVKVPVASSNRPVPPVIVNTDVLVLSVGDVLVMMPLKVTKSTSPFAAVSVPLPVIAGVVGDGPAEMVKASADVVMPRCDRGSDPVMVPWNGKVQRSSVVVVSPLLESSGRSVPF